MRRINININIIAKRYYSIHQASEEYYEKLPRLPKEMRHPIFYNFTRPMLSNFIIEPFLTFVYARFPKHVASSITTERQSDKRKGFSNTSFTASHMRSLMYLPNERKDNDEDKLTSMAKEMIIQNNLKFSRVPTILTDDISQFPELFAGAAAIGSIYDPYIILFPGFLYSANTLPKDLSVLNVSDEHKNKDEWILKYETWLIKEYINNSNKEKIDKLFDSQFSIDFRRLFYGTMLTYYQSPEIYDNVRKFLIGHEMSHLYNNDLLASVPHIGIQLLLLKFYWPLLLLDFPIRRGISRIVEKRCDMDSIKWGGKEARLGGIRVFEDVIKMSKIMSEKYPELKYSKLGSNFFQKLRYAKLRSDFFRMIAVHPDHKTRLDYIENA